MFKIIILVFSSLAIASCVPVVVGTTAGTAVAVSKDRSIGKAIDDVTISAKIKKDFIAKGFRELYTTINVEVMNGRVMFTGAVKSEDDIIKAVEIAWSQAGVKEVINELQIDENSHYFDTAQYSRDSWITSQIKAKTIMRRKIKFVNYTVVTSRNIVYLFGIARSEEEMESVANIAAEIKGVKKVVSHVQIKELEQIHEIDQSKESDHSEE